MAPDTVPGIRLPSGSRLRARVLRVARSGNVCLQAAGVRFEARTEIPLLPGELLELAVEAEAGRVRLRRVAPAGEEPGARDEDACAPDGFVPLPRRLLPSGWRGLIAFARAGVQLFLLDAAGAELCFDLDEDGRVRRARATSPARVQALLEARGAIAAGLGVAMSELPPIELVTALGLEGEGPARAAPGLDVVA